MKNRKGRVRDGKETYRIMDMHEVIEKFTVLASQMKRDDNDLMSLVLHDDYSGHIEVNGKHLFSFDNALGLWKEINLRLGFHP